MGFPPAQEGEGEPHKLTPNTTKLSSDFKGEGEISGYGVQPSKRGRARQEKKRVCRRMDFVLAPRVEDNLVDSRENYISPPHMGWIWGSLDYEGA